MCFFFYRGIQNKIDSDELRALFRFALKRMMQLDGVRKSHLILMSKNSKLKAHEK